MWEGGACREAPGGSDASQQMLGGGPQGQASTEAADGLSATTAMLLFFFSFIFISWPCFCIKHWLLKQALGD